MKTMTNRHFRGGNIRKRIWSEKDSLINSSQEVSVNLNETG